MTSSVFRFLTVGFLICSFLSGVSFASTNQLDANRLTYLDEFNPFAPGLNFPKLTTPQWIGEEGVEAVVILSIDDMGASERYENFLRSILDRLKKIDARAPVSIFSTSPNPEDPQLQTWLTEGLSFEVHTLHHPCPLLAKANFAVATNTFHGCVDLLNHIPGNKPVAFRMPCCDSLNSASPRFYAEIFNRANAAGQFLTIDSSVFNITTSADPNLPRELTVDADGREKFRKYVPFPSYAAFIENYPYPYQIGKTIWEFPCAAPSDWEGQNLHKTTNHPTVVADWKAAIDATVIKQGVFTLVIHPHGWIRNDQIIELIDYVEAKYGNRIKFLNFREAQERLDKNLLLGQPIRAADGQNNGVRLMDLNADGYMDVVIGNDSLRKTRVWNSQIGRWSETDFPIQFVTRENGKCADAEARFSVFQKNGFASFIVRDEKFSGAWNFDGTNWLENKSLLSGLEENGQPVLTRKNEADAGVRLRDINNDGRSELIVANDRQNAVFEWSPAKKVWTILPFALPEGARITDATGRDLGLRFVDVNEDGFADVLFSNEEKYSLHLFLNEEYVGMPRGWSHKIRGGKRGDHGEIPMIVRAGEFPNNGAWFRNRTLWVQNENTADKPDLVDRRTFDELLALEASSAKSPQESLACFKVRPGFKVELVASEPLVQDPIAFEWGADAKLWVLEMGDYPVGTDGKGAAGGRVRFLEDTNSDGIYDKSTLFLESLNIPSGIYPWREGVLVAAAPDIFYAEDSDGDGKADAKKVLFSGFNPGNPQHRVNGFDYGLDNWLYGANGDSGGQITSALTGKKAEINGRDFRFRPDTGEFESESGQTQFGRHRDDWGNWFGNNNPTWLWHYLFAERYLARNPHLPVRNNKRQLANYPDSGRTFPASQTIERFNDPSGFEHVTSANSAMPYRDDLFGPDFSSSVFVSEPVHNLIHREALEADGVTFKSRRAPDEIKSEFLASTDNWFRPAMTKTGPDGALYIADMYRLVIEHPEWIPAHRQKRIDLRAGADRGRIFRVYPQNAKLQRTPRVDQLKTKDLVAALESENGWKRDTAQRLLVDSKDKTAIAPLKTLASKSKNPKTRLQALCTLEGLNGLTPGILTTALGDSNAFVKENAIRASESVLKSQEDLSNRNKFNNALLKLADDPEIRVRYQLAFTLGDSKHPLAAEALAKISIRDWRNAEMQIAVMSSALPHLGELLTALLAVKKPPADLVEQLIGLAATTENEAALVQGLGSTLRRSGESDLRFQFKVMAKLLQALARKNVSLETYRTKSSPELKSIMELCQTVFQSARTTSVDPTAKSDLRLAAISILGETPDDLLVLGKLLGPQNPTAIQAAALAQLKTAQDDRIAEVILDGWKTYSPSLRVSILDVLFSRANWVALLLLALESEKISAQEISATYQQRLLANANVSVRSRAEKIFRAKNSNRQSVVEGYKAVVDLKGNVANGATLFQQNCASCHRIHNQGSAVGADLAGLADKPVDYFLLAILDPNQSVEDKFISYSATTKSGREINAVIVSETANSIAVRTAAGTEEVLLRSDLIELKSSRLSLMPEGFENNFAPQAMADLISYLKSNPSVKQ